MDYAAGGKNEKSQLCGAGFWRGRGQKGASGAILGTFLGAFLMHIDNQYFG
jgi:hypothetical protein